MKTHLKEPCNDCPFRRNARPGWLGPWKSWELLMALDDNQPFACHKTISGGDHAPDDPAVKKMQSCAGAALFLNNQCKLSRDVSTSQHQRSLRELPSYAALSAGVFSTNLEFNDYHHTNLRESIAKYLADQERK